MLAKLVAASKMMDALFLRQVWAGNETMLLDLLEDQSADGRARLHYFLINKGPWSRLDHNAAVRAPARRRKPRGGELLSGRRDKAEIETWIDDAARRRARAGDRVLHDDPPRRRTAAFAVVPYSVEYQSELAQRRARCCARRRR